MRPGKGEKSVNELQSSDKLKISFRYCELSTPSHSESLSKLIQSPRSVRTLIERYSQQQCTVEPFDLNEKREPLDLYYRENLIDKKGN